MVGLGGSPVNLEVEAVARDERPHRLRLPWQRPNRMDELIAFARDGLPPDSLRTPLPDFEQADLLDRGGHPFYRSDGELPGAEAEFFLARRGDEVVGRIGAIVNHGHNRFESEKTGQEVRTGYFGFYEALPDQAVADALLEAAAGWLRARGMHEMLGPASPSHNYYYGSRDTREERPPLTTSKLLEAYNPAYYNEQYEAWGLKVVHRMFGYDVDLLDPRVDRVSERFERTIHETIAATGMQFRRLDLDDFDAEITRANELINLSLAQNWGFSPMTRAELAYMGEQMRLLIDPNLVLFVELEGEPVGISLAMPDYNQLLAAMGGRLGAWPELLRFRNLPLLHSCWPDGHAWSDRRIDTARVIALGVLPTVWRGRKEVRRELLRLGPALVYQTFRTVKEAGYRWMTASWILESNRPMQAPFEVAGIGPARVWKVWGRSLVESAPGTA